MLALLSLSDFVLHLLEYHASMQLANTLLPRPCAKVGSLSDCFCRKCCSLVQSSHMYQIAAGYI